jgi:predicted TIM-barrel fold metal-dependent hydrolase
LIIDINAWLGHWPFRPLRHKSARQLLREMDKHGIDKAVVSSINGMFYKNAHASNEELHKEVKSYPDRLIPFATLNPEYPGWQTDLQMCREKYRFQGIRLHPAYHRYNLEGPEATELIIAATEFGWPIQLPMRVADRRQRHPWDQAEDLKSGQLVTVFKRHPGTHWIILNGAGIQARHIPAESAVLVEFSRMTCVLQNDVRKFIKQAGPRSLAFGTGMPFKAAGPSVLKLNLLRENVQDHERIAWKNAAEMLGLPNSM